MTSLCRCVHYNNLPDSCYLEKDPANPCCDRPKCVFPVNFVTDVGQVRTTPGPRGGKLTCHGNVRLVRVREVTIMQSAGGGEFIGKGIKSFAKGGNLVLKHYWFISLSLYR